jgi:hypothetical protein
LCARLDRNKVSLPAIDRQGKDQKKKSLEELCQDVVTGRWNEYPKK